MARSLKEIVFQLRANIANPSVRTTLIQTEDLEVLCNAAEDNRAAMMQDVLNADAEKDQDQMIAARHVLRNAVIPPTSDNDR